MPLRDPRDRALVYFVGAIVVAAAGWAIATSGTAEIDEGCVFAFQCRTYEGFRAPTCSTWGQESRCTLTCVPGVEPECPEGMRCTGADMTIHRGADALVSIPLDACHRSP